MRRREFIVGLAGAAASPMVARAQQADRERRIGVLIVGDENGPTWPPRLSAFTQALADLGWTDGRTVRMDVRWAGADNNRARAQQPDRVRHIGVLMSGDENCVHESACGLGLDRWPQRANGPSVGPR